MASVDELRASMQQWAEKAMEALGPLQQAHDTLEEARAGMVQTAQQSSQDTAQESIQLLSKAMADIIEVQHTVNAAATSAQQYSASI